ncbi:MAG TPA: hypothetical protein VFM35_06425 [Candidatus Binatia bacterium]|nr:hypothetical protein [Candidatus Binatia bacterium]
MTPGFGLVELLIIFIVVVFNLALPLAILFLLYKIYVKLQGIEEYLKKNRS